MLAADWDDVDALDGGTGIGWIWLAAQGFFPPVVVTPSPWSCQLSLLPPFP